VGVEVATYQIWASREGCTRWIPLIYVELCLWLMMLKLTVLFKVCLVWTLWIWFKYCRILVTYAEDIKFLYQMQWLDQFEGFTSVIYSRDHYIEVISFCSSTSVCNSLFKLKYSFITNHFLTSFWGGFAWVRIEGFGVKVVRKIYHLTIWGYQLKEVDCKWCVKLDGVPKQKFGLLLFCPNLCGGTYCCFDKLCSLTMLFFWTFTYHAWCLFILLDSI